MRKLISIRIDSKIYQKARELNLNISKTCEKCLKQEIQRPTNTNPETNCILTCEARLNSQDWWAGQDLNLRPQPRKGCVLTELDYRPVVQNYGVRCFIKGVRELKVSPVIFFCPRVGGGAII